MLEHMAEHDEIIGPLGRPKPLGSSNMDGEPGAARDLSCPLIPLQAFDSPPQAGETYHESTGPASDIQGSSPLRASRDQLIEGQIEECPLSKPRGLRQYPPNPTWLGINEVRTNRGDHPSPQSVAQTAGGRRR